MFKRESEVTINLKSDPILVGLLRSVVAEIASKMGFNAETINNIQLAVNEAHANVIKHTYKKQLDKDIIVKFLIRFDRLEIIIKDFGEKILPDSFKSRPLDQLKESGLGVYLIKSLMDEVNYDTIGPEAGTELHLVKYLNRGA